jgi:hypothetical protein
MFIHFTFMIAALTNSSPTSHRHPPVFETDEDPVPSTSSYTSPVKAENLVEISSEQQGVHAPLAIANVQSLAPATGQLDLAAEPLNLAAGPLDLTGAQYPDLYSPISAASDTFEESPSSSGCEQDHENAREKTTLSPYHAACSPISSASETCEDSASYSSGSEQDQERGRKNAKLSKKRRSPSDSSRSRSSSRERKRQRLEGTASFAGRSSAGDEDDEMPTVVLQQGTQNINFSTCFYPALEYYTLIVE